MSAPVHTVHGVGKDITAVGHGVENTSGKNN
ncbi:MAG: entericidin A/B family lipoprotein [Asticcacaulis sp.]